MNQNMENKLEEIDLKEIQKETLDVLYMKYPQLYFNMSEREEFLVNVALDDFRTLVKFALNAHKSSKGAISTEK